MKSKPLLTLLAAMMFLCPGNASGVPWPREVTVVSPAPGAAVDSLLSLMGRTVVRHTPIERWDVQPLGGPEIWLPMMKDGRCHFANHGIPDMIKAYQGRGVYARAGPTPVRTAAAGHGVMFMFWTIPEKQIGGLHDLKGKRVFVRYKTNPLFIEMAEHQLASAGLGLNDLRSVLPFSNLSIALDGLFQGMADAVLFPVVRHAVEEINRLYGECQFVPLTSEQSRYVVERLSGYHVEDIPADDPRFGNVNPVPNAICYQNAMFCPPALAPEVAYGVVKAIFDHNAEMGKAHPFAPFWSLNYRPVVPAVPYHEGAIRYFREKGLWTPEAQIHQERMLSRERRN